MNVNVDMGSLSLKEPPQPQSRLSQWTHPNSMESLSGNSSPLEPNLGKHGEIKIYFIKSLLRYEIIVFSKRKTSWRTGI